VDLGLLAAIALAALVPSWLQRWRRRRSWVRFAAELGCTFSPADPFGIPGAYRHSLFTQGEAHRAYNVVYGVYRGRGVRCFDYSYDAGLKGDTSDNRLTCVVVEAPISFPSLIVRPEGFLDRFGHTLGVGDIEFESDEFNRMFLVKCHDRRFAFDVIHQRAMAFLLRQDGLCIEGNGTAVLFHLNASRGLLPLPAGVTELLDESSGFLDLLPDYLLHDHGARPQ
jgi:hypothetical protein